VAELVVASYNVHGGVDGWGRSFDVAAACRELDADVLVLQEVWAPDGIELGADVAQALGYESHPLDMARALMHPPAGDDAPGWGPPRHRRHGVGLRVEAQSDMTDGRGRPPQRGKTGIAMLSRVPLRRVERVDLGRFPGDLTRRGVLVAACDVAGRPLIVAGTHMPHLRHGSLVILRRLRRALTTSGTDTVLVGDMNLWGPPLGLLFPGWHRPVRGRTWPAWRPLAQLDHILVGSGLSFRAPQVVRVGDSDHRAVRATVVA